MMKLENQETLNHILLKYADHVTKYHPFLIKKYMFSIDWVRSFNNLDLHRDIVNLIWDNKQSSLPLFKISKRILTDYMIEKHIESCWPINCKKHIMEIDKRKRKIFDEYIKTSIFTKEQWKKHYKEIVKTMSYWFFDLNYSMIELRKVIKKMFKDFFNNLEKKTTWIK